MPATHFYYGESRLPTPNKPLGIGVTALIFHPETRDVLLEQRSDNRRWSTLGGNVDRHEHPEDALLREITEETGLTTMTHRLVGTMAARSMIVAYPDGNIIPQICLVYQVEVAPPAIPKRSSEALELRYVPLADALHLDLVSSARYQLEQIAAGVIPFVG